MRYVVLAAVCLIFSPVLSMTVSAQSVKKVPLPHKKEVIQSFPGPQQVESVLTEYLDNLKDREETDLISQDDIQPLFKQLEDIGWKVADERELKERLLKDKDWLVTTLRTRTGTKFMRKIAEFPGGYAQLDLMRQSSQGKKEVAGIITTPGGEELIEFLTTSPVGRNTSQKLAAQHRNKSKLVEDRLYTKDDIHKQFKLSYAAEVDRQTEQDALSARTSTKGKRTNSKGEPQQQSPAASEPRPSREE
ncbi:MAG: hypothetical protein KDA93_02355 [Planctomycetaceae bacterium]|nr:hypothetical protein [Planctomycetaceae bacterium]